MVTRLLRFRFRRMPGEDFHVPTSSGRDYAGFSSLISGACTHARMHMTYGREIPERAVLCCEVLPVSNRVHSVIPTVCPAYTWQSLVRVRVRVAAT